MTTHGQPDQSRSARYILKDYVNVSTAAHSSAGQAVALATSPDDLFRVNNEVVSCDRVEQGKLLYCHPPPHIRAEDFQHQHGTFLPREYDPADPGTDGNTNRIRRIENPVDKNFFHQVRFDLTSAFCPSKAAVWVKRCRPAGSWDGPRH